MKVSVLFFISSPRPQVAFLDNPPRKCLLRVKKIKSDPPKTYNSGTVSRIQFKLGTTQVASRDMTPSSKGQGHVTYSIEKCNDSVLSGRIKFIRTTPN